MAKKRSKSSQQWLQEHHTDPYVKRAQQEGYPSRAAYKLLEIQAKDKLLRPGMVVVDLGAAPGGWSMVAKQLVGDNGLVIALDLLPLKISGGIEFILGDFSDDAILAQLLSVINARPVDIVLCDIAPNMSGNTAIDQPKAMGLAEMTLEFAKQVLDSEGALLVKVFQGEGFQEFLRIFRQVFVQVKIRKPKSSRARSNEVYLLGLGLNI